MMRARKEIKAKLRRKTGTRILKWVLAIAVALIALAFVLVPVFVSSQWGQKIILAKINDFVDGQVDFGTLSMSWWRGIKVTDLSFNDSSGQTLVEIKQIAAKPHYGSILLGSLSFGKTIIDEPTVVITLKGRQIKKVESRRQEASGRGKSQPIVPPIKKIDLVINDGNLKVTDRQAKTVELAEINSSVKLRLPGQQTNFDIDMVVADGGKEAKIHTAGWIMPKQQTSWSLKGTSGDFTVEVNDLELESLGPISALAGIEIQAKGEIWANIQSEIKDGRVENLSGTIKGRDLDVTGPALKGDRLKSSVLDVDVKLQRQEELINIDNLQVHSDWLDAKARGVVPTTFESLAEFVKPDSIYNLRGSFKMDLAEIFSQMPRTFGVKKDVEVNSGQLSGNIEAYRGKLKGQATCVGLAGVVGAKSIALSQPVTAQVEITSDEVGVNFDKLNVSAPFAQINCTGSSKLLKYKADVDLAKLQTELGQFIDIGEYQIGGEVFSEGEVSGNKDRITAVGSAGVKELRLSSTEGASVFEPMVDVVFAFDIEQENNIVNVSSIKVNASFGQVSTKDAVLPLNKKAAKPMSFPISAKVDLQKLQPFAVLLASFPKEMQLSGVAESQITVSCKKDSYYISTDSTKIRNLKLESPGQQPFEQEQVSLVFDAEVNPVEKTIAVRKLQLISPQIKIYKSQFSKFNKNGKTKLEGRVECEYDWSAISTVAGPFLPKGLKLEGKREDAINFSSEYPTGQREMLLANLSTKGKLGFDRAYYKGLNFSSTETEIQIVKGLFTISQFSSKVNNGIFRFAGKADFKQKPTLLKTLGPIQIAEDVQINDEMSRELLAYVNPIFANAFNISGVGNFNCERLALPLAGTPKEKLEIIGTIWVDNIRLSASDLLSQILSLAGLNFREQNIKVHPTRFILQNGFLRYDNMQIDVGDNPVVFGGVIGLVDESLNMTVTLPYTLKGRTARVGEKTIGERITLPLKGTIDKPELDVSKLIEEQLKKQLEQQLREKIFEGLDKLLK